VLTSAARPEHHLHAVTESDAERVVPAGRGRGGHRLCSVRGGAEPRDRRIV